MKPLMEQRPVDRNFEEYNKVARESASTLVLYIAIPLTLFGLMGLAWAIPFPHLAFLGKYNGYLNWASFLIAVLIYYHLRLSPILSYAVLFVLFAFSYGIIQFEHWEKVGGPSLWLISAVVFLIGLAGQLVVFAKVNAKNFLQLIVKSPTWLLISIIKQINLKY